MGVRDRIKNRLKKTLLGEGKSKAESDAPSQSVAPSPPQSTVQPPAEKELTQAVAATAQPIPPKPVPPVETKAVSLGSTKPDPAEPVPTLKPKTTQEKTRLRAHNDAPSRNAHLRPTFNTSGNAFTVHVECPEEGLSESFPCEPDEFVLEAAERAGVELPFSCRSGGCLSCAGRLIEGKTEMTEQFVLEESHIAEGFRLLCCTTVQSNASFVANQEEAID